jgi:hypothetical protein
VTIVRIPSSSSGPVDVYTSRVRLLPADQVVAELQQSGFEINTRIPVNTSDTAHPVELIGARIAGPRHPARHHSSTGNEVSR